MQNEANALHFLQYAASLSSILTSLVASLAAVYVWYGRSLRRRKLEHYLADVIASAGETGERRRSILHLIAALGIALMLALYSGAAAEVGHLGLSIAAAVSALVVAAWVAITLVPVLAKRTPHYGG